MLSPSESPELKYNYIFMNLEHVHCPLTRNSQIKVNKDCVIGWVELVWLKFKTRNAFITSLSPKRVDCWFRCQNVYSSAERNKKFHFKFDIFYELRNKMRPNVNIMLSMISIKLNFHFVLLWNETLLQHLFRLIFINQLEVELIRHYSLSSVDSLAVFL